MGMYGVYGKKKQGQKQINKERRINKERIRENGKSNKGGNGS
jgi:uncharacterized protein YneF (UPF0154 family)